MKVQMKGVRLDLGRKESKAKEAAAEVDAGIRAQLLRCNSTWGEGP